MIWVRFVVWLVVVVCPIARRISGKGGSPARCAVFPEAQLENKTDKLYEVFMENRKPPIWVSSDHVLAVAFAVRLNGKKGVQ